MGRIKSIKAVNFNDASICKDNVSLESIIYYTKSKTIFISYNAWNVVLLNGWPKIESCAAVIATVHSKLVPVNKNRDWGLLFFQIDEDRPKKTAVSFECVFANL